MSGKIITKPHVLITLLLSLINTVLVTLLISIYWSAEAVERMAAAGIFPPVLWIVFACWLSCS